MKMGRTHVHNAHMFLEQPFYPSSFPATTIKHDWVDLWHEIREPDASIEELI